jgi:hypothetical protein
VPVVAETAERSCKRYTTLARSAAKRGWRVETWGPSPAKKEPAKT